MNSEDYLEHSSGPWKKHKYIKKIGDRYVYARDKIAGAAQNAREGVGNAAEGAGRLARRARRAVPARARYEGRRVANAAGEAAESAGR